MQTTTSYPLISLLALLPIYSLHAAQSPDPSEVKSQCTQPETSSAESNSEFDHFPYGQFSKNRTPCHRRTISMSMSIKSPFTKGVNSSSIQSLHAYYQARYQYLAKLLDDRPQKIEACYVQLRLQVAEIDKRPMQREEEEEKKADDLVVQDAHGPPEAWHDSMTDRQEASHPIQLEALWEQVKVEQADDGKDPQEEPVKAKEVPTQAARPSHHLFLTGVAGSGKSTLTQRIVYEWSKQQLWNERFHWVLLVPLRQLQAIDLKGSYADDPAGVYAAIAQQLQAHAEGTAKAPFTLDGAMLQELLTEQAAQGLLILDGYDEVANLVETNHASPLGQWLRAVSQQDDLHILLTSRPNSHYPHLQDPRKIEVVGFAPEDVQQYVKAYFAQEEGSQAVEEEKKADGVPDQAMHERGELLLDYLQQDPSLRVLSRVPFYVRLLCLLARQDDPKKIATWSLAQLYEQLIQRFFRYAILRRTGRDCAEAEVFVHCRMEFDYFTYLAWLGMESGQATLSTVLQQKALDHLIRTYPRRLQETPHFQRIQAIGLLQGGGVHAGIALKPKQSAYFPHLTLQEFLAAYFLADGLYAPTDRLRHTTARQALTHHRYRPRYQVMLPLLAGILYQRYQTEQDPKATGLQYFWELLAASPRELSGIHHLILSMRCLENCRADTSDGPPEKLREKHQALLTDAAAWLTAWLQGIDQQDWHFPRYSMPKLTQPDPIGEQWAAHLPTMPHILRHEQMDRVLEECFAQWAKEDKQADKETLRKRMHAIAQWRGVALGKRSFSMLFTWWHTMGPTHPNEDVRKSAWNPMATLFIHCTEAQQGELVKALLNAVQDAYRDVSGRYPVRKATWEATTALFPYCTLAQQGKLIEALLNAVRAKDKYVRRSAWEATLALFKHCTLGQQGKLIEALLKAVQREDRGVWKAMHALFKHCTEAQQSTLIKALLKVVQHEDGGLRKAAWDAIPLVMAHCTKENKSKVVKAWLSACKDEDSDVCKSAWDAMPALFPHCTEAQQSELIEALLKAVQGGDSDIGKVAWDATPALITYCTSAQRGKLIEGLQNAVLVGGSVRKAAWGVMPVLFLHCTEAQQGKLIEALLNAVRAKGKYVCRSAWEATLTLFAHCTEGQQGRLTEVLPNAVQDGDKRVRILAWKATPALITRCTAVQQGKLIEALLNAVQVGDSDVCKAAWDAMPVLFPYCTAVQREGLIKGLLNAVQHKAWDVRKSAWDATLALCTYCTEAQRDKLIEALQKTVKTMQDSVKDVRISAWEATPALFPYCTLAQQGKLMEVLPNIRQERDGDWLVRSSAYKGYGAAMQKVGWETFVTSQLGQVALTPIPLAQVLQIYRPLLCYTTKVQKGLTHYQELLKALRTSTAKQAWQQKVYATYPLPRSRTCHQQYRSVYKRICAYTPLHKAAAKGALGTIQAAWSAWQDYLNHADTPDGRTPLLCALAHQHWAVVQWLIDQGAWLDVADQPTEGKQADEEEKKKEEAVAHQPSQGVEPNRPSISAIAHWQEQAGLGGSFNGSQQAKDTLSKQAQEALQVFLRKRTRFPQGQLKRVLDYLREKITYSSTARSVAVEAELYRQEMHCAVGSLLGKSCQAIDQTLAKCGALYFANRRNIISIEQEGRGQVYYNQGSRPIEILTIRLYILFEHWYGLQAHQFAILPKGFTATQIQEMLEEELITELTTYWDEVTVEAIWPKYNETPKQQPLGQAYLNPWAAGVVDRLGGLADKQELTLAAGYQGHCLYLSLRKMAHAYTLRIDNLYLEEAIKKCHPRDEQGQDSVQPALITYFSADRLPACRNELIAYLAQVTENRPKPLKEALAYLYQIEEDNKPLRSMGQRVPLEVVANWPYRPQQIDAQNCVIRSHNVGLLIRLGTKMCHWFYTKELGNECLFASQDHGSTQHLSQVTRERQLLALIAQLVNENRLLRITLDANPIAHIPINEEPIPYHDLAEILNVHVNRVGPAVAKLLVEKAGIRHAQDSSLILSDPKEDEFRLRLALDPKEYGAFITYYNKECAGLIEPTGWLPLDQAFFTITSTSVLEDKVKAWRPTAT